MAFKETKKKIHFTPFDVSRGRGEGTSPAPTMTLAQGKLRFSSRLIQELNLNGKFVRLYYDQMKNIIGFQVKNVVNLEEMKGKSKWRLVRQSSVGQWSVQLMKVLEKQFGKEVAERMYSNLPVQKYVEQSDPLSRGEIFYFVELDLENVKESRKYNKKSPEAPQPTTLDGVLEEMTK